MVDVRLRNISYSASVIIHWEKWVQSTRHNPLSNARRRSTRVSVDVCFNLDKCIFINSVILFSLRGLDVDVYVGDIPMNTQKYISI